MLMLAGAVRILLSRHQRLRNAPTSAWRRWGALAVLVLTLYGLIWGAAAFLFLDPREPGSMIFLEFQQVGNIERDRRQGLGLGLSIVKRLADLLGHPFGVVSTPGRGSCFWVEVPLASPQRRPILSDGQAGQDWVSPLDGCRVLVLDDEVTILNSMRALLKSWGCEVSTAAAVEQAIAALSPEAPDLLIVDYRLAGVHTGLDAIARL
jgi:two-component system CheB/CheR fusion protein